ncbi:MAG: Loki-CTERM sorting domain-containing protein [Candidatus Hodarchaeales archaeon]|jgi:hypothetical protein
MKRTNLLYFIGIGLLAFLPFIRTSVAAPPCWVGINVGDTYTWTYTTDTTARDGAWDTDGVALLIFANMGAWMGWVDNGEMGGLSPGNMSHEITVVNDLAADVEYATGYQSVLYTGAVSYESEFWTGDWADKDTGLNVWNGIIIEDETEYVDFHEGLAAYFGPYGLTYHTIGLFVPTNFDWAEIVTAANTELGAVNATVTVETDATEEVGFKISVAALAWGTNTLAVELSVTFDEAGLLDVWDLTYGVDSILKIEQIAGRTGYTACPTGGGVIPGYELPIIIGVVTASIISLILIKKIKNK